MASILKNLRLLADPSRLRILLLLEREEVSVAELQEILAMGQSRISTHLSQLKQTGLVEDRRNGKSILYRLKPLRAIMREQISTPDDVNKLHVYDHDPWEEGAIFWKIGPKGLRFERPG